MIWYSPKLNMMFVVELEYFKWEYIGGKSQQFSINTNDELFDREKMMSVAWYYIGDL